LITFGAPRSLKPSLARKVDSGWFENYRIINSKDPIPVLPPSFLGIYRHCGTPFYHRLNFSGNVNNPGSWFEYDNHDFHGEFEEEFKELAEHLLTDPVHARTLVKEAVTAIDLACHILHTDDGYGKHIRKFMNNIKK
jgi:hypothetical protein